MYMNTIGKNSEEGAAWSRQSQSLVDVQIEGGSLERLMRSVLQWNEGRITYDSQRGYRIQVDAYCGAAASPEVVASATYSNPDTPGHSNENKLQLKLGELALLKAAYKDVRAVLVLGGREEAWLAYVLEAFRFFFDEVVQLWEPQGEARLKEIAASPKSVRLRHPEFWAELRRDWGDRKLLPEGSTPPHSLLRYQVLDRLLAQSPPAASPSDIADPLARYCMSRAQAQSGREWQNYREGRFRSLEMSRSYFNPVEAAVELSLKSAALEYEGGLAQDVAVRSFLPDLGMERTKMSEDFLLYSEKLEKPVYVQCKSSGGGRSQHGKNIMNRTKEQVARSILYRARIDERENLVFGDKDFYWIGILDGKWGLPRSTPLKYLHMLQLAGYDELLGVDTLLELDGRPKPKSVNPLVRLLVDQLKCR